MDETMIDAVSVRWDNIVAAATESSTGEAKQGHPVASPLLPQQSPAQPFASAAKTSTPVEPSKQVSIISPSASSDVTVTPKTYQSIGQTAKGTSAESVRYSCAEITNLSDKNARESQLQNRMERFHQDACGAPSSVVFTPDPLVAQMANMSMQSSPKDLLLYCVQCRNDFTWPAAEQEAFRKRGLNHEPRLCGGCRTVQGPTWK